MSRPFETVDSGHRFSIPLNMKLSVGIKLQLWLLVKKLPYAAVFTFTYEAFKTDTPNTTQLLTFGLKKKVKLV